MIYNSEIKLTGFEKSVIDTVEFIIASRDCPHRAQQPCDKCVAQERTRTKNLLDMICEESDRRVTERRQIVTRVRVKPT